MDKEPSYKIMHFMRLLGIRIGNQLESAYLTGISTAGSPAAVDINQLFNGWEYQAVSNGGHVVDGSTAGGWGDRYISTAKLSKLIKSVPVKYRTNALDFRMLTSPNIYQDFVDLVGNRATPFGDVAFQNPGYDGRLPFGRNSSLAWGSIPIYPVPLLPETEFVPTVSGASTTVASGGAAGASTVVLTSASGFSVSNAVKFGSGGSVETKIITNISTNTLTLDSAFSYARTAGDAAVQGTADGTFILLTHFQNLIVGVQRDIRIELDRRPRERATYAVVTLRVDVQVENPDAMGITRYLAVK